MKTKILSLVLVTAMVLTLMSGFTVLAAGEDYDELDLSATALTTLDITDTDPTNNSTKIVVRGMKDGVIGDVITDNLSYVSSDESVATVSADGVVTAKDEGFTVIRVSYPYLSKRC